MTYKEALRELRQTLSEFEALLNQCTDDTPDTDAQELADLRKRNLELVVQVVNLQRERNELQRRNEKLEAQVAELQRENKQLDAVYDVATVERGKLFGEVQSLKRERDELQAEKDRLRELVTWWQIDYNREGDPRVAIAMKALTTPLDELMERIERADRGATDA